MDPDAFIDSYGAAIDAGQASLLIGAGLSVGAGYPGWDELLDPIAAEFGVPVMRDQTVRAQYIENQPEGRERLGEHVVRAIGAVDPVPLVNHTLLAQLGIADMWTTNFDPLIETADSGLTVITRDEDLAERAVAQRRLCKMHGSVPRGEADLDSVRCRLVLSRGDYERYEWTHPRLWRLLQAQFLTSSFLFLGFSMTDPNFEAVFRIARHATADRLMQHYAIMKRSDSNGAFDFRAGDLRQAGVELVEVADYREITTLLQRLVARTRPSGLFVSGSYRSPADAEPAAAGSYPTAPSDEYLDRFAEALGHRLAVEGVPSVVAAGELGAKAGYRFLTALEQYDPGRFVLVRRRTDESLGPPSLRQGQMHFVGEDPGSLRAAAFEHVRAVVLLGGGPGTESEASRALELDMTVVPVAHTGGAARRIWETMSRHLDGHRAGQRRIDPQLFADLASTDFDTAMWAATELILAGLFLPRADGR